MEGSLLDHEDYEVTWNQRHPDEQRIHGTGILTYHLVILSGKCG